MSDTLIIGIGHVKRTGKDTAAAVLQEEFGFVRYAFAGPLLELAMEADPLVTSATRTVNTQVGHGRFAHTVRGLGYEAAKNTYPEVRSFLQKLGVGARKVFGENFWVDQLMGQISRRPVNRVVVPDVRFINEAEAIKAAGGVVVRVDRPGFTASGHVSETELLGYEFDHVLVNDGTLEQFKDLVRRFATGFLGGVGVDAAA